MTQPTVNLDPTPNAVAAALSGGVEDLPLTPRAYLNLCTGCLSSAVLQSARSSVFIGHKGCDAILALGTSCSDALDMDLVARAVGWAAERGAREIYTSVSARSQLQDALAVIGFATDYVVCRDVRNLVSHPSRRPWPGRISTTIPPALLHATRGLVNEACQNIPRLGSVAGFRERDGTFLAFGVQGSVIGIGRLWIDAAEAFHELTYVRPGERGRGVGRDLRVAMLIAATRRGCSCITSTYVLPNTVIGSLNQELGYVRLEENAWMILAVSR